MYSTTAYIYQQIQRILLIDTTGVGDVFVRRWEPVYAKKLTINKGVDNVILFEFINQDLKSKTTTDAITKSLSKNISEDDTASKQRAANIAEEITEKISVESSGILKGVYVLERKVSSDTKYVVVTVQVDKRSMNAARQLRVAMGN